MKCLNFIEEFGLISLVCTLYLSAGLFSLLGVFPFDRENLYYICKLEFSKFSPTSEDKTQTCILTEFVPWDSSGFLKDRPILKHFQQ